MKKMLFILLIFAIFMTSCRDTGNMSAYDIMAKLKVENGYVYINGTDISSINYISSEKLGYLYYGEKKALSELDYTESYCIYMSKSLSIGEIHIFKSKYQSDVDKLKRMLKSRADLLSKPQINPNNSDFLTTTATECRVFSKGRFVFLVAEKNSAEISRKIKMLF